MNLKFKNLELSDKKAVSDFTLGFPPYSDFNFTSLYSYDVNMDAGIYVSSDTYIIKLRDYVSNNLFYSYLTHKNSAEVAHYLIKKSEEDGLGNELKMVPEHSTPKSKGKFKFAITEDRNNFDYVLPTKDVSLLLGSKYEHHRWRVNQFKRNNPGYEVKILSNINETVSNSILDVSKIWTINKNVDSQHEMIAIKRLLKAFNALDLVFIGIYCDGILSGFAIVERLNETYAMGHFMKADTKFKGLFNMLYWEVCKYLQGVGCKYLNYEQDLGDENLRTAKLYWKPEFFLKKFTVSLL